MPLPSSITDLSTTAASNYPAGSDSPSVLDDVQRAHASFIAQLRDGTGFAATALASMGAAAVTFLRGYQDGCTLSTAGGSATMSISAGSWIDSTNTNMMVLASAYTKTTSNWVVGSGTGAWSRAAVFTAAGTVHWYLIRRPDTGVIDLCASPSATGLVSADFVAGGGNVADAYTQWRRIGSWLTASSLWVYIVQNGDKFMKVTPTLDINTSSFADTSTLYTMSVPTGLQVEGIFTGLKTQGNSGMVNFWQPSIGAIGASTTVAPLGKLYTDSATGGSVNTFTVLTNTSAQIYGGASATNQTVKVVCEGWIDTRGRNA